ncbi:histone protein [Natrarchaeobaculum sulfurireducens]|uniref:Copper binding protein n=1 Tax=Natrarchaeobaculum sulfurireducens TaxID=2044521 RepID=A0A346PDC5_9EURY|nr:Copper binding protein [Natrarchaeobaculum sulfurireducens]AXR82538.1 histone protein [Natrarchaeobaculum sulfurireducens]
MTGGVGITALIAGCADDEPVDDEEPDDEEPVDDEEEPDDEQPDDEDGIEIEPGTEIVFEGLTEGWLGVEPEEIEGEENPTLALQEGEEYEMGWEEGDGSQHNIEIWDEDGEVVDDLQTEIEEEGGEDQFLEFEATDEMAQYVCEPHETTMIGDLEITEADEGPDDDEAADDDEDDDVDDEEVDNEEMDDEDVNDEANDDTDEE